MSKNKLVFIYKGAPNNPNLILPKVDEVVTLHSTCPCGCGDIQIVEYPISIQGKPQSLPTEWFRKVEPSKQKTSYRLANLEILTQFPVIRETSDQPLTQPLETQYEIEEV